MNSSIIIIIYVFLVIFVGLIKKVDCYHSFIEGSKEGARTVINMFSSILTFIIAINLINSCGIIKDFERYFKNDYLNPLLIIQGFIRPFSASSSMAMMITNYENYKIDSYISIASTLIHTLTDSSFYMITFYLGYLEIKKYRHLISLSLFINLIGFILALLISYWIV